MSSLNQVRPARLDDMDWLIAECAEFGDFFGSKIPLYNPEHLRSVVLPTLMESHLLLVAEVRGERAGFIAGIYSSHFLNPSITTLSELLFWVTKKHRGSRAAAMLMNAYIEWGKTNADWVTMATEKDSSLNPQSLISRGFVQKEQSYLMEVGV